MFRDQIVRRYSVQIGRCSGRRVAGLTIASAPSWRAGFDLFGGRRRDRGHRAVPALPETADRRIVGSDIAHAVPLTLVAGIGHWWLGSIDLHLLIPLLLGSVPGIVLGSYAPRACRRWRCGCCLPGR